MPAAADTRLLSSLLSVLKMHPVPTIILLIHAGCLFRSTESWSLFNAVPCSMKASALKWNIKRSPDIVGY